MRAGEASKGQRNADDADAATQLSAEAAPFTPSATHVAVEADLETDIAGVDACSYFAALKDKPMGWRLLDDQAIAEHAGAGQGGGQEPKKPADLGASGEAEEAEDFQECEEVISAFGQLHRIQSQADELDEGGEVECHVVSVAGESGSQRAGKKLIHGVLCDTGAGATVADGDLAFPEFPLESSAGSRQGQTFVGPGRDAIENRGERKVHLRLGTEQGRKAGLKFQDAKVRRPILSVGESTGLGNSFWYDQEGSHILPVNCQETRKIRELIRGVKDKLTMRKERNVFVLDAWIDEAAASGFPR